MGQVGERTHLTDDVSLIQAALSLPVRLDRREDRVALELHREVLRVMLTDLPGVRERALANLAPMRASMRSSMAQGWMTQWEQLLTGPLEDLVKVMVDPSERGVDLRQVGPFLGVLSQQERLNAISRASRGHTSAA